MLKNNKNARWFWLLCFLFLSACGKEEAAKKTISFYEIEDIIRANDAKKVVGVDFTSKVAPLKDNSDFDHTPTGGYINLVSHLKDSRDNKLVNMVETVLDWIGQHKKCIRKIAPQCTPEFLDDYSARVVRNKMVRDLTDISLDAINNEIRNYKNFVVYYNAFPGANRLYLDVLRKVRSYEYLTTINNSYMFRDFPFTEGDGQLERFLRGWWPAYAQSAEKEGKTPWSTSDKDAGHSVGLTFYPDSIGYAKSNLISANLSLFGNNSNLLNNTIFFFLNNRSATKGGGYDQFLKATLSPYVLGNDGQPDESRLTDIIAELNRIYDQYLSAGGGNLAQIFIKDTHAEKVSFLAWNGGEPVWFSKKTKTAIQKLDRDGAPMFKPTNVFWPNKEQNYFLFDIAKYQKLFSKKPSAVQHMYPITGNAFQFSNYHNNASPFLELANPGKSFPAVKGNQNYATLEQFTSVDLSQARIIPSNDIFSNEGIVGVKLYTANPISENDVQSYERALSTIIKDVFRDFLEKVNMGVVTLKPGVFPLKSLLESKSQ